MKIRTAVPPILLLAAALAGAPAATAADVVLEQLDAARQAYSQGELRSAVDQLNAAIASIQEQMTGRLRDLLPEPLAGWQADAPESQSGGLASMITGTAISRRYFKADGSEGEVTLNVMADSPMMPMLTMAMTMPFVMQANPDMKPFTLGRHRGMLQHEAGSREFEITVMVGTRLVIQAEGQDLDDVSAVDAYLQALDIDAIERALTN